MHFSRLVSSVRKRVGTILLVASCVNNIYFLGKRKRKLCGVGKYKHALVFLVSGIFFPFKINVWILKKMHFSDVFFLFFLQCTLCFVKPTTSIIFASLSFCWSLHVLFSLSIIGIAFSCIHWNRKSTGAILNVKQTRVVIFKSLNPILAMRVFLCQFEALFSDSRSFLFSSLPLAYDQGNQRDCFSTREFNFMIRHWSGI